jgi:hypothetical protein
MTLLVGVAVTVVVAVTVTWTVVAASVSGHRYVSIMPAPSIVTEPVQRAGNSRQLPRGARARACPSSIATPDWMASPATTAFVY